MTECQFDLQSAGLRWPAPPSAGARVYEVYSSWFSLTPFSWDGLAQSDQNNWAWAS